MKDLELERKRLEETIGVIRNLLHVEEKDLENLYKSFVGPIDELWTIADRKKIHISNLETSLEKPYFARIDFTSDVDGKTSTIYIGKNGIIHDNSIVVTDWRAPISSLYYDSEVGKCAYEAVDKTITGEMTLKRQFEIENRELLQYFDVDLVSNDELLQKYLNENNDARLKSIVSTIQKEQNEVIRKAMGTNLIIQGVAGSGKTTVALHRIAYLVYNYIASVHQNQYLVIGPNPVFIKYIKSVLPDLDVTGVEQATYENFATMYIGEDITINSSDKKINTSIMGKNKTDIDKFKSSMFYKDMLDLYLEYYFQTLTSEDLKIGDFVVLKQSMISEVFKVAKQSYNGSLDKIIEIIIERLYRYIEDNNEEIISRYNNYLDEVFKQAKTPQEKDSLRVRFTKEREEIKKNCRKTLRKYFSKSKVTPIKLYREFITKIASFDIYKYPELKTLKKETLENIKNKTYDFEDLAALIYLKQSISKNPNFERIRHVVVDEAQDLGEFNFYVMKQIMPSATFSIFGDLAQSIYDYRGINSWDQVNDVMFNGRGEIVNFRKSYRTTSQIMKVADNVATSIGLDESDLVVREGNSVEFTNIEKESDIPNYIISKIAEYKAKGYKTIAIISKTNLLSCYINDDLNINGLNIANVTPNDDLTEERFRVCTISNQLAKGLEFDAVIINGASEDIYSSKSSLDMKLLYVAITRALHELDIVYSGELTKPLQKCLLKEKQKQLVRV